MNRDQRVGSGRLFLTDASIASMLLNEARHRVLGRMFGITRADSPLVTLIVIRVLAGMLNQKTAPVRKAATTRPSVAGAVIGVATLNETAHRIAGDSSRDTPFFGPLLAFALVAKYHPVVKGALLTVRGSIRGVLASSHKLRAVYKGRYER